VRVFDREPLRFLDMRQQMDARRHGRPFRAGSQVRLYWTTWSLAYSFLELLSDGTWVLLDVLNRLPAIVARGRGHRTVMIRLLSYKGTGSLTGPLRVLKRTRMAAHNTSTPYAMARVPVPRSFRSRGPTLMTAVGTLHHQFHTWGPYIGHIHHGSWLNQRCKT